ncbi:uncharacterized protein LOC110721864 [Chenopodium quinoa]|uniref:uncharacterized protein LOC110721864 n=1 Tax=Chenopodium quinoa TaxID=63459 RepID=UPI000B7898EF|nr:uncharacterized protein LOC110721864 [Chenopodium quinoa]
MAKQGKGRKPDTTTNNNVGKGKVTPVQVAFIVDRYLADNNYSKTRSAFHSEVSSLISKSFLQETPKSLLSLGELLDEYIWLKEQKVIIEQEKNGLVQEKCRIQTLLQGMQDLMNVYNSAATVNCLTPPPPPPPPPPPASVAPNSGYSAYRTPVMTTMSMTQSVKLDHTNYSTPIISSRPPRKRKTYKDAHDVPQAPKKYCTPITNNSFYDKGSNSAAQPSNAAKGHVTNHQSPPLQSLSPNFAQGGSPIQGSHVAKNLFDKPSGSPTSNSSGPKTPPRALSSQSDKSTSPLEDVSSTAKSQHDSTPPETTPTNCTIYSSKTIIVSPAKHISIERNQCTFSSPVKSNKRQGNREHVKGRLDFDSTDMPTNVETTSGDGSSASSESEREVDIFDMDLANFDAFGPDFCLTELLTDFGIDCGGIDYSCPSTAGASTAAVTGLNHDGNNEELGSSQDFVEHSSAVREVFTGDMTGNGSDSITRVNSMRKCVRIVSPTKCSRNSSSHET